MSSLSAAAAKMFKIVSRTSETNLSSFNNLPIYKLQIKRSIINTQHKNKHRVKYSLGFGARQNVAKVTQKHCETTLKWRFQQTSKYEIKITVNYITYNYY